jgi:uncharacterized membrane protein (UPF0127 family)
VKPPGTLRNQRSGEILAPRLARASGPLSRLIGLLGSATLLPDEGLWIDRCNAVHTLGMRATLDLYFLDRDQRVLKIANGVVPNRLAEACSGAKIVVELGSASGTRDVVIGDRLVLEERS